MGSPCVGSNPTGVVFPFARPPLPPPARFGQATCIICVDDEATPPWRMGEARRGDGKS